MKVIVHDYAGHPFQVALSRELARRNHDVTHVFFEGDRGPKGDFRRLPADSKNLSFSPVNIGVKYEKGNFVRRRCGDLAYGVSVAKLIAEKKPDIVLSGNTPTESQGHIVRACKECASAFIYWVQDFYSLAVTTILSKKLGFPGQMIGMYYRMLERRQMSEASGIVTISTKFEPLAAQWGRDSAKVTTIENWGLVNEIRPVEKANPWAMAAGLSSSFNFLYSGTLGLKHNPDLLLNLARAMRGKAKVVVVSVGSGTDLLRQAKSCEDLQNLILLPLQPFETFDQVLGAADVSVAVIEREAGTYSVPSKVQSYLCSSRPILLAAPAENLAAVVVRREQAGLVVDPTDVTAFVRAAEQLQADAAARTKMASNGRRYASSAFDIGAVADRFESVFSDALRRRHNLKEAV